MDKDTHLPPYSTSLVRTHVPLRSTNLCVMSTRGIHMYRFGKNLNKTILYTYVTGLIHLNHDTLDLNPFKSWHLNINRSHKIEKSVPHRSKYHDLNGLRTDKS